MSKRLEALLDEAIERLRRGESVEALLAAYSRQAQSLRPLLETALKALSLPPPPEPRRLGEGWTKVSGHLEAQQGLLQEAEARRATGLLGALVRTAPQPLLRGATAVLLVALFSFGGLVAASSLGPADIVPPAKEWFGRGRPPLVAPSLEVEFEGTVSAVQPGSLSVDVVGEPWTVLVGQGTAVSDPDDRPVPFGALAAGQTVEVEGVLRAQLTVAATRVHIEDRPPRLERVPEIREALEQRRLDVEGVIVGVEGPNLSVVDEEGQTQVVILDLRTELRGRGPAPQASQLVPGLELDVDGVLQGDGTVLAQRVKVEGPEVRLRQRGLEVEVRGLVVSAQGEGFQVMTPAGPLTVVVGPDTRVDLQGHAQAIAAGVAVDVSGVRQADGSVLALRVQVRSSAPVPPPFADEPEEEDEGGQGHSGPGGGD